MDSNSCEILHFWAKLNLFVCRETSSIHHRSVAIAKWELKWLDTIFNEVLNLLNENLLSDTSDHLSKCPSRRPLGHKRVCVFWLQSFSYRQIQTVILRDRPLKVYQRWIWIILINVLHFFICSLPLIIVHFYSSSSLHQLLNHPFQVLQAIMSCHLVSNYFSITLTALHLCLSTFT